MYIYPPSLVFNNLGYIRELVSYSMGYTHVGTHYIPRIISISTPLILQRIIIPEELNYNHDSRVTVIKQKLIKKS